MTYQLNPHKDGALPARAIRPIAGANIIKTTQPIRGKIHFFLAGGAFQLSRCRFAD